jgi:hypothetical protein
VLTVNVPDEDVEAGVAGGLAAVFAAGFAEVFVEGLAGAAEALRLCADAPDAQRA